MDAFINLLKIRDLNTVVNMDKKYGKLKQKYKISK